MLWEKMKSHWDDWGYPLRPNPDEVRVFESYKFGNTLLLGDTQELIHIADSVADERSGKNWFDTKSNVWNTIIGDGCLTCCDERLIHYMLSVLRPGGKLVLRVFLRNTHPDLSPSLQIRKFQGFKENYISVKDLYEKYGDTPTTRDYKDSDYVYYFPDLWQLPKFSEIHYQKYKYGQFFPIIVWTA